MLLLCILHAYSMNIEQKLAVSSHPLCSHVWYHYCKLFILHYCYCLGNQLTDLGEDVHTVASLLKLYLRELPEPVVDHYNYRKVIDATKGTCMYVQCIAKS